MPHAAAFLDIVRSVVADHRMLRRGERVLVGVSGGPDSLALLSALVALAPELKIVLRACYVDHGLRPAACPRERQAARRHGRMWGVPVTVVARRVRRRGGQSLEAAAREARYDALASAAGRFQCSVVAVGHTADDQAETVLMWLLRGAGTAGLAGIPPVRTLDSPFANKRKGAGSSGRERAGKSGWKKSIRLIRPLIGCTRAEVQGYLKGHGLRPLLDRSNLSERFTRNRIRNELIGLLERRYNPQLRRHLCAMAEILRGDLDWLDRKVRAEFHQVARVGKKGVRFSRAQLRRMHPALRRGVLREAVRRLQGDRAGFGYRHWQALERLARNGGRGATDLPHGFRVEPAGEGWLLLSRKKRPPRTPRWCKLA